MDYSGDRVQAMRDTMATQVILPISLHLQGKTCLVVGGGSVAETRVRTLLACQALVRLVSPEVTPWLATMARNGVLQWQPELFQPGHLAAIAVVFIATSDRQTNAWITTLAKQQHCLVNVADDPALCDFSMPAIVRRGDLTLAVSTAGQSPAFAAWLRKRLERLLDFRLGQVVAHYARLRPFMKQCYPDMRTRAQAWDQLLTDDAPPVFRATGTDAVAWHEPSCCPQGRALVATLDQEIQHS
jgi:precorrin-2 dehydrogenase/sirohydrochlorin ferrochelatase